MTKETENKEILKDGVRELKTAQKHVEFAINSFPTGDYRNELTNISLLLLSIIYDNDKI